VILGGPAERAGVQPGDTLIAVGGIPVTSAAGRTLLYSLPAGRAVPLELGRAGERLIIRVIPAVHPMDLRPLRVRMMPPGRGGMVAHLFRIRGPLVAATAGQAPEFRLSDDTLGAIHVLLPNRRMTLRGDAGQINVEFDFSKGESARFGPPAGEFRHYVVTDRRAGTGASPRATERQRAAARYVWLDAELGPRLNEIRDSVLQISRSRLDSLTLMRLKIALAGLSAAPELQPYMLSDRRVAGAEFEPVSPGLAEVLDVDGPGLLVLRVLPKTPAALLGLRAGDVVVEVAGGQVASVATLRAALEAASHTGIEVKWHRKGITRVGLLRAP